LNAPKDTRAWQAKAIQQVEDDWTLSKAQKLSRIKTYKESLAADQAKAADAEAKRKLDRDPDVKLARSHANGLVAISDIPPDLRTLAHELKAIADAGDHKTYYERTDGFFSALKEHRANQAHELAKRDLTLARDMLDHAKTTLTEERLSND
jgi:hypothetical protein